MEEEKGLLARQKEEWRSLILRAPSRRRWGLVGLVLSLGLILFGLPAEAPGDGLASFPPLGVLEKMGTLFGSLTEPMPEEQTTPAGILRLWACLFVACGFVLMVVGIALGGSLPLS